MVHNQIEDPESHPDTLPRNWECRRIRSEKTEKYSAREIIKTNVEKEGDKIRAQGRQGVKVDEDYSGTILDSLASECLVSPGDNQGIIGWRFSMRNI